MDELISRQAAIDALTTYIYNVYKAMVGKRMPADKCRQAAESVLGELPTVQPKHGTWKKVSADKYRTSARYIYRCDKCGEDNWYDSDFCPCCGADMRCSENPNS